MATLYQERAQNIWRTAFLMAFFLAVVLGIGYFIGWYYDLPAIMYGAIIFAVVMNFWSYWFSDKTVLSLTGARPATREEFFDFYTVTENLSIAAGLPMPKLYVIEDEAPNAFATGRDEKHAVVCATTGLLAMMTRPELEGVIGHELSHVKNRDILVMTVAVVLAGFLAIISDIFIRVSFWGGGRSDNDRGSNPIVLIVGLVAIILAPIAAQLIQLAISRQREYLADASGVLLTRYPEGLASALEKIGSFGVPMRRTSHATAHLFIGDPYASKKSNWINNLFSTHPPIADRVNRLLGRTS